VSDNNLCQSGVEKFRTVSATGPLVSNDIINIDCHGSDLSYGDGYDSKDLVIIDEEVSKSNKGKQIEAPHQVVVCIMLFVIIFCSRYYLFLLFPFSKCINILFVSLA
jgi:hypothetical protein